jgi:glutathione S-transferase
LLEVDGHKLSQSGAIVRFLARRLKLQGTDEFETAKCDEVFNFFYDQIRAQLPYTMFLFGFAEGNKVKGSISCLKKIQEKLHNEVFLPVANKSLEYYSKLLKENNSGFVLESGISYADFVVAEHLNTIFQIDESLKAKHPDLVKYMESIHSMPQIAEYVKSRPASFI